MLVRAACDALPPHLSGVGLLSGAASGTVTSDRRCQKAACVTPIALPKDDLCDPDRRCRKAACVDQENQSAQAADDDSDSEDDIPLSQLPLPKPKPSPWVGAQNVECQGCDPEVCDNVCGDCEWDPCTVRAH